jgi:adenylate cyclase
MSTGASRAIELQAAKGDGMTGTTPARFTLGQFLAAGFAGLAIVLAVLLAVFYGGSRRTVLLASERLMGQASRRVNERIAGHLGEAERLLASFESEIALGLVAPERLETVEPALLAALTAYPHVTLVTFTWGRAEGSYAADEGEHEAGELRLAPEGRMQISVGREGAPGAQEIVVRHAVFDGRAWRAAVRRVPADAEPRSDEPPAVDPTAIATFTVASRPDNRGRALWSDLAYAQSDGALPEAERRHIVSVQKGQWSPEGVFDGVLKVSLLSDAVDELARVRVDESAGENDPHVVFICDHQGRLISRLNSSDRFALLDASGKKDPEGDLRVTSSVARPAVEAALRFASTREPASAETLVSRLDVAGTPYLASVASLDRTQGWLVGIVVPEAHYLRELAASLRRALVLGTLVMLASIGAGAWVVRSLRRDIGGLVAETTRLGSFGFAPAERPASAFRDVQRAAESLEQAKTALRALGKYVPLDLVRLLYDERREPTLGAKLQDVTLLFSDIEGFTSISERLEPNLLARALGAYLEVMTRAVHATGGIIDKYTGDGVMALWNTPRPCESHPLRACEAALASLEAADALFTSPAWEGLEPWRTRIGIHRAEVSVGHYGAPDRMSFTALGDGVNLASRLESLNKQYGTRILVTVPVEREARATLHFRRIDRVAVKGKREGVEVFELLGRRSERWHPPVHIERYEKALEAYFARRFDAALEILGNDGSDPPAQALAERCRRFLTDPPPPDWMGVWIAREK